MGEISELRFDQPRYARREDGVVRRCDTPRELDEFSTGHEVVITPPVPECDFCNVNGRREYRAFACRDFEVPMPGGKRHGSVGAWAACTECAPFIAANDREGIYKRVARIFERRLREVNRGVSQRELAKLLDGARHLVRVIQDGFWANRSPDVAELPLRSDVAHRPARHTLASADCVVPTFVVSSEQAIELMQCRWSQLDDTHVIVPFDEFAIRVEPPLKLNASSFNPGTLFDRLARSLEATFLDMTRAEIEDALGRAAREMQRTLVRATDNPHVIAVQAIYPENRGYVAMCDTERGEVEDAIPSADYDANRRGAALSFLNPDDFSDGVMMVRFVISFLLMLNSRATRAVYDAAPTRQMRRHAERTGERIEHVIRVHVGHDRVVRAVRDAASGLKTHARAAHSVRAHLRHLSSGAITKVRSHARGGKPTSIPIYDVTALAVSDEATDG